MKTVAERKFKVGDRVELTHLARAHNIGFRNKAERGTVVGFKYDGYSVKVLVDGMKQPQSFHPTFWRVVRKAKRALTGASQ